MKTKSGSWSASRVLDASGAVGAQAQLRVLCSACGRALDPLGPCEGGAQSCPHCGQFYHWDGGILVLGESGNDSGYSKDFYQLLAAVEHRHCWFAERNGVIVSSLRRALGSLEGKRVLDVGCGTGFVLARLEREGTMVCGLDMHLAGLRHARQRLQGLLVCESAARIPFEREFDVVLLCDVIEHCSDDSRVLQEASRALTPRGIMIITVPALPWLWTAVDEASGHQRRYTKAALTHAMQDAGLRVRQVRYFNALVLPAQLLQRWRWKRRRVATSAERLAVVQQALDVPSPPLNAVLHAILRADARLSELPLPLGTSLIAVGELV